MRNVEVLEMINKGRIEDLRKKLEDEIYTETLKGKAPGAKQRYAAMKKYFGYAGTARESLSKPCEVEYEGKKYISFCNAYSLALTTETCGEMEMGDPNHYPDISRLVRIGGDQRQIDFTPVIAEAKSKGYKNKKSEFYSNKFLMRYEDTYFRLVLFESTYNIINDGGEATVYFPGHNRPMVIQNDIGICVVMPVRYEEDPEENGDIVVTIK